MKYWESIFQMSHTLSPSVIVSASGDRWRTNKENGITSVRLPGLPDGLFRYQNSQFWFLLMAVGSENF
jgi:hypothetical protein